MALTKKNNINGGITILSITKNYIYEHKFYFLILFMLVFVRVTLFNYNHIPSSSMNPNLFEGDIILVNKVAYSLKIPFTGTELINFDKPDRGDVVTFDKDGISFVKRVMAIPNDRIQLKKNTFYINGQKLKLEKTYNESVDKKLFLKQELYEYNAYKEVNASNLSYDVIYAGGFSDSYLENLIIDTNEYIVPEGEYFMIGDNRNLSKDSRYMGTVNIKDITGKVVKVGFNYLNLFSDRDVRFMKDTE